jgi:hypothetical protein
MGHDFSILIDSKLRMDCSRVKPHQGRSHPLLNFLFETPVNSE